MILMIPLVQDAFLQSFHILQLHFTASEGINANDDFLISQVVVKGNGNMVQLALG